MIKTYSKLYQNNPVHVFLLQFGEELQPAVGLLSDSEGVVFTSWRVVSVFCGWACEPPLNSSPTIFTSPCSLRGSPAVILLTTFIWSVSLRAQSSGFSLPLISHPTWLNSIYVRSALSFTTLKRQQFVKIVRLKGFIKFDKWFVWFNFLQCEF